MIKRFTDWLKEAMGITSEYSHPQNPHHDLWKHGLPAIKNRFTGHTIVGKRGEAHEDMLASHGDEYVRGIYHKKAKQFYRSGKDTHMDSTDLMSAKQRMDRENRY